MDLRKQKILRRGSKNTQNYTKKIFMTQIITMALITHLEPGILECEVKWALENIITNKASGGDRILVQLFQILKDDAVKVLHSICQKIWKTQQFHRTQFSSVQSLSRVRLFATPWTATLHTSLSNVMPRVRVPKTERIRRPQQCKRMLKLPHNCTHLTY